MNATRCPGCTGRHSQQTRVERAVSGFLTTDQIREIAKTEDIPERDVTKLCPSCLVAIMADAV